MSVTPYANSFRVATTVNGKYIQEYIPINGDWHGAKKKAEERKKQLREEAELYHKRNFIKPMYSDKPWVVARNFQASIGFKAGTHNRSPDIAAEFIIRYKSEKGAYTAKKIRLSVNGGLSGAFKKALDFYVDTYNLDASQKVELLIREPEPTMFTQILYDRFVERYGEISWLKSRIEDSIHGV